MICKINKKKSKFLSNDNNEFVFFSISRRFKRFQTKSTSHINILNNKNNRFFLSFNEFQFSAKNIDSRRNNSIIARSNFKKFIKN